MSVITFGAWRVIVLIQGQSGNGITVCTNSFRVRGPRCFHGHPFAYFGIHGAFFSGQVHDIAVCLASGIDTACNDQFGLVHGIAACLASVIATACNHQVHRGGVDWYAWPIACDAFTAATWAALQAVDAAYTGVLNNFFGGQQLWAPWFPLLGVLRRRGERGRCGISSIPDCCCLFRVRQDPLSVLRTAPLAGLVVGGAAYK